MDDQVIGIRNITQLHAAALAGDRVSLKKLISSSTTTNSLEVKDEFGRTPLIYSIMGNHLDCAILLLKFGARVDNSDNKGQTALHWAAYKGLHWCVKMLLEKGALWHQKDIEGITALHLAAHHKSPKCLSLILKELQPGQVDIQDSNKRTALHWSAKYCSAENIQMLLKEGANICIPDVDGKTPLHWVANCNNPAAVECVKMLLNESPGVINWQDYEGRSALHSAVATGTTEVVDILTSKEKCNTNLLDNMFRTPLHWAAALGFSNKVSLLLDRGADYSSTDGNGARPLHYAAQGNHAETVSMFLSRCYVKDEPDFEGFTALMWAAARQSDDVIQIMHDYGIDISAGDKNGTTALHAAASQGHVGTIDLLLDLGAKINAKDKEEMTPLLRACEMGRVKAVQLLYERGANLFAIDVDGQTALHWASRGGHAYLCQILLQHSVDIDAKDFYGRTALMYASFRGYMNCMSVMLENKASPDYYDNEGKTALQWACIKGNLDAVRLLLEYGADVNFLSIGEERYTPLDYAVSGEHQDVVQCLQEHGGISRTQFQEAAAIKIQAFFRGYKVRKVKKQAPTKNISIEKCLEIVKEYQEDDLIKGSDPISSSETDCMSNSSTFEDNLVVERNERDSKNVNHCSANSQNVDGSENGTTYRADDQETFLNVTNGIGKMPSAKWQVSQLQCTEKQNTHNDNNDNYASFFWGYKSSDIKKDSQTLKLFQFDQVDMSQPVYCAKCGRDILGTNSTRNQNSDAVEPAMSQNQSKSSKMRKRILELFGSEAALKRAEEDWAKKIANLCIEVIPVVRDNGTV